MNLRELWDTVVLRDILGYIFPGSVTLLALSLLARTLTGVHPADPVSAVVNYLDLRALSCQLGLPWQPWILAATAVPISYALGHLQAWAVDLIEDHVPLWNLGHIALSYLQENDLGDTYARAACARFFYAQRDRAGLHPLVVYVRKRKADRERQRRQGLDKLCEHERRRKEAKQRQVQTEGEAGDLWRLCDRYVFHEDRDIHSMFMGRYYVLAVLFSNLGLSLILLGLSVWASWFASDGATAAAVAVLVVAISIILGIPRPQRHDGGASWATVAELCAFGVGATAAIGVCLGSVDRATALVPTASGVLLIWRSGYFRKRFVECTFPIFYAIVQEEERSGRLRR